MSVLANADMPMMHNSWFWIDPLKWIWIIIIATFVHILDLKVNSQDQERLNTLFTMDQPFCIMISTFKEKKDPHFIKCFNHYAITFYTVHLLWKKQNFTSIKENMHVITIYNNYCNLFICLFTINLLLIIYLP